MHQQLRRGGLSSIGTWFYFTPTYTSSLHQPALPLYLPWKFCKAVALAFIFSLSILAILALAITGSKRCFAQHFLIFGALQKTTKPIF